MTRSDMTRERLPQRRALSYSLPPCGGGLGRGVAQHWDLCRGTPLPAPLRAADLSHKGRGNKNERPS
jgi:hypothetical protein